jgi:hypothetical protein
MVWRRAGISGVLAAVLSIVVLASAVPRSAAAEDAEARYQRLLAAAQAQDAGVDWAALRFAYADRPNFNPFEDVEDGRQVKAMNEALAAKDFAGALAMAKAIEAADFVEPAAHFGASRCYSAMGDVANAEREQRISLGLLRSMQTGDGLSPASPYTVIKVSEEYLLLLALARRPMQQSLIERDGHSYDVLTTAGADGRSVDYYFLIDRVRAAERKATCAGQGPFGGMRPAPGLFGMSPPPGISGGTPAGCDRP